MRADDSGSLAYFIDNLSRLARIHIRARASHLLKTSSGPCRACRPPSRSAPGTGAYGLVGSIELVDDTSHVVGVHAVEQAYERLGLAGIARVINAIRGQVVDLLNGGSIRMRDMIDVVNHIRCYPDLFPEWHASETAKLFAPPIFP